MGQRPLFRYFYIFLWLALAGFSNFSNAAISILGSKSVDFTTSCSFDKYVKIKRYFRITFMLIAISMAISIYTIRLG